MEQDFQKVMKELHSMLQSSLLAASDNEKAKSFVSLMLPGIAIDEADYGERTNSMQVRVDNIVNISPVYDPTSVRLSGIYGQILTNTEFKASKELTSNEKVKLKKANAYIKRHSKSYNSYQEKLFKLQISLSKAASELDRKKVKKQLLLLQNDWNANGKEEYEGQLKCVRELRISSPASYFSSLESNFQMDDEHLSLFTPEKWYLKNDNLAWQSINCSDWSEHGSTRSSSTHIDQVTDKIYQRKDIWAKIGGWFGVNQKQETSRETVNRIIEESNKNFNTSSFEIAFSVARVGLQRDWMDTGIFGINGTRMSGYAAGGISTGDLDSGKNTGIAPAYISDILVAKDIELTMDVSRDMASYLEESIRNSTKATVSCGPFSLNENSQINVLKGGQENEKGNVTIRLKNPSKQMIGVVASILPAYPKETY